MKRQHFVTCWDIIYFVMNSRENLDIPKFKIKKNKKNYALDWKHTSEEVKRSNEITQWRMFWNHAVKSSKTVTTSYSSMNSATSIVSRTYCA